MFRLLFVVLFGFCAGNVFGQGNVEIVESPDVQRMKSRYLEAQEAKRFIEGWRVEILATTDRQRMESALQTFRYRYPNIPTNWIHNRPYYKLRAGAYATKLEAIRLQYLLKRYYPAAYPAVDNRISPEELLDNY